MKEIIKVGVIGLGGRGGPLFERVLLKMKDVEVTYICDINEKKLEEAQKHIEEAGRPRAKEVTDYTEMLKDPALDAVFLFTGWDDRIKMTTDIMRAGKYAAIEVGCAANLEECFELVSVYEETGTPVMMLENSCYGKRKLTAFNMIRKGLFGDILYLTGGYCHYLPRVNLFHQLLGDNPKEDVTHYRLAYYINDNCDNYPTHPLGPISKCLRINRGNRFVSLSSFSSKSLALKQFAKDNLGEDNKYAKMDYKQGDIFTTIFTCENGEMVQITLDTTAPRPNASTALSVRGTKGMLSEDLKTVFLDGMERNVLNNEEEFFLKYEHPLQKEFREWYEKTETHLGCHNDGMDWMVFRGFIESVKNGTNTPIDAYDTATWMAVGPLTRMSAAQGGMPIAFPDFTNGKYKNREPLVQNKYCLDEVIEDNSYTIYDCIVKDSSLEYEFVPLE